MKATGYSGDVYLISPDNREIVRLHVPGRREACYVRDKDGQKRYVSQPVVVDEEDYYYTRDRGKVRRQNRRFKKLLSQGWRVATPEELEDKFGPEWKKFTTKVDGSKKTGDQSHGGDHASGEVPDSPNRTRRGKRGGRGKRKNKKRFVEKAMQTGSEGVICLTPICVTPQTKAEAEASAELLSELVGLSSQKVIRGTEVNTLELLIALEVGDDPIPALEAPAERPKAKILVTPDISGSCQNWSGLSQAWALHLAELPDVEVIYAENFNGQFVDYDAPEEISELLSSADIVIYLGDRDGWNLCRDYASQGATVLALDCHCASVADPRLMQEAIGSGSLFWVDRVSAKEPTTWTRALELCFGK